MAAKEDSVEVVASMETEAAVDTSVEEAAIIM